MPSTGPILTALIALNLATLVPGRGRGAGGHRVAEGYYRALASLADPGRFSFLFIMNRGILGPHCPTATWMASQLPLVPAGAKPLRPVWDNIGCPIQSRLHGARMLHYPLNLGPLFSLGLPVVVTVHDLASFFYAREFPHGLTLRRRYLMAIQRRVGARATVIITDTAYIADLAAETLQRPRDTIHVVPLGVLPSDRTAPGSERTGAPTILCVTSGGLHKNVITLLEAFALLRQARTEVSLDLVGIIPRISERDTFGEDAIRRRIERLGLSTAVRVHGYIPDDALDELYYNSTLVVAPSLYEGFGLPLLEAMARGRPVAAADIPVFREVAGNAALYFDPRQSEAMAEAMQRLIDDPAERQRLAQQGRELSKRFSWEETGRRLLHVYRAVC